uniref:(northern house mosquito) hypothetical protein n=1 Tax=Culex pipiens TaxID=7175 RepID=A0A8D8A054_CULPI
MACELPWTWHGREFSGQVWAPLRRRHRRIDAERTCFGPGFWVPVWSPLLVLQQLCGQIFREFSAQVCPLPQFDERPIWPDHKSLASLRKPLHQRKVCVPRTDRVLKSWPLVLPPLPRRWLCVQPIDHVREFWSPVSLPPPRFLQQLCESTFPFPASWPQASRLHVPWPAAARRQPSPYPASSEPVSPPRPVRPSWEQRTSSTP